MSEQFATRPDIQIAWGLAYIRSCYGRDAGPAEPALAASETAAATAAPPPASGTVAWLIDQLAKMPPDALVTRYCDEVVERVELRSRGRDAGWLEQSSPVAASDRHVALW